MLGDKLSANKGQAFNKIKEQGIIIGAIMGGTMGSKNDESLMSEDSMSIVQNISALYSIDIQSS
jgi:hypothetical protein